MNSSSILDADNILSKCTPDALLSAKINKEQCPSPKPKTKQTIIKSGFTLIELMIGLSVLCLLLVIATPSFRNMLLNTRITAQTDSLVNALNFARSTALYQAINVAVCPLGALNSTACGADWSSGWIVVTQPAAGASTLLKSQQSLPTDPVLTSNVASVVFDSHGIGTTQSNFKFCDTRGGAFARSVQVLATGFVQSGDTPGQAVWNNSALACP